MLDVNKNIEIEFQSIFVCFSFLSTMIVMREREVREEEEEEEKRNSSLFTHTQRDSRKTGD